MKIDNSKVQVVSFSGGRTSAYMVYLIEQMRKSGEWTAPTEYIFMDTGAEHPETYEFIKKCVEHFGVKITCIRSLFSQKEGEAPKPIVINIDDAKPDLIPFSGLVEKHGVPYYPMGRQCTYLLKTQPFTKYCDSKFGKGQYVRWLGIRSDEPRRLTEKENVAYLACISDFEKQDVLSFWEKMPFDLKVDEWLGNCMFCIQKKVSKIALAAIDEPIHAENFINMINAKAKRKQGKKFDSMYEHDMSLGEIIKVWSDFDRDEVMQRVVRGKRTDTGSCSESCEPFQDELFALEYK